MSVVPGKSARVRMLFARLLPLAAACVLALLAAEAGAAGRASVTMPLGQGAEQRQEAPGKSAAKAAASEAGARPSDKAPRPAATAPAKGAREKAASGPKSAGLKGFSSNPFSLDYRDRPDVRKKPDQSRLHYGGQQANVKPLTLDERKKLSVSATSTAPPDDRLKPHRGVFPGASNTLSRMDIDPPPEVNMEYRLNGNATTRLTVNPQDESSPLPRPAEQDGAVNAAGVYVKVDVAPDVQLKVGGEYCDLSDPRSSGAGSSTGASVGLKWDF